MAKYRCFTRTWWKTNKSWPDGREPHLGTRRYAGHPSNLTEDEARRYCRNWNAENKPGKLSRKCEFEAQGS